MSGIAITFFIIAAVLVWGGLIASIIFLARKPQLDEYPEGSELVSDDD
ncbi:MetS family NSS transporter small subunit [Salinibacterium sp. M195]|nr:MetS family NSS transporter small subunit [Salinibacterium sp. M195]QYH34650.1 MetS family NSS transporter small subunit [Salinibacterium sp. M195]